MMHVLFVYYKALVVHYNLICYKLDARLQIFVEIIDKQVLFHFLNHQNLMDILVHIV